MHHQDSPHETRGVGRIGDWTNELRAHNVKTIRGSLTVSRNTNMACSRRMAWAKRVHEKDLRSRKHDMQAT